MPLTRAFLSDDGALKGKVANQAFNEYALVYVGFSLCDENGVGFFKSADEIKETLGKKYKAPTIGRIYKEIVDAWSEEKRADGKAQIFVCACRKTT